MGRRRATLGCAHSPQVLTLSVKRLLHAQLQFLLGGQLWLQAEGKQKGVKRLGVQTQRKLGGGAEKEGLRRDKPANSTVKEDK